MIIAIFNSLSPSVNGLDPDQARHFTLMVFLKEFLEKFDFEKKWQTAKKHEKFSKCKELGFYSIKLFAW